MKVSGENYPPKPIFLYLSYVALAARLVLILLVIAGPDAFLKFGMQPPSFFERAYDNKVLYEVYIPFCICVIVPYCIKF